MNDPRNCENSGNESFPLRFRNRQRLRQSPGPRLRAKSETARGNHIGVCVPVLGELYYGIELSATRERNRKRLRTALKSLTIWPYTERAAQEFGRLAAHLRRTGRPMQQIDIQIAAIALTLGDCTVVTTDSDLSAIPGLSVEDWTT